MANLPKYTLTHNDKNDKWDLTNGKTDKTVKSFENKCGAAEAMLTYSTANGSSFAIHFARVFNDGTPPYAA